MSDNGINRDPCRPRSGYSLTAFDLVFCPGSRKFRRRGDCHYCGGLAGDYSEVWGAVRCSGKKTPWPAREWTLEEVVELLLEEQARTQSALLGPAGEGQRPA